jgi:hypothetical protein
MLDIISGYQQRINELEMQNSKLILILENEELKEKWNNRFNDQQSRVESIIEIAKCERRNIYNDIISLINDQDRFSLDSILLLNGLLSKIQ